MMSLMGFSGVHHIVQGVSSPVNFTTLVPSISPTVIRLFIQGGGKIRGTQSSSCITGIPNGSFFNLFVAENGKAYGAGGRGGSNSHPTTSARHGGNGGSVIDIDSTSTCYIYNGGHLFAGGGGGGAGGYCQVSNGTTGSGGGGGGQGPNSVGGTAKQWEDSSGDPVFFETANGQPGSESNRGLGGQNLIGSNSLGRGGHGGLWGQAGSAITPDTSGSCDGTQRPGGNPGAPGKVINASDDSFVVWMEGNNSSQRKG